MADASGFAIDLGQTPAPYAPVAAPSFVQNPGFAPNLAPPGYRTDAFSASANVPPPAFAAAPTNLPAGDVTPQMLQQLVNQLALRHGMPAIDPGPLAAPYVPAYSSSPTIPTLSGTPGLPPLPPPVSMPPPPAPPPPLPPLAPPPPVPFAPPPPPQASPQPLAPLPPQAYAPSQANPNYQAPTPDPNAVNQLRSVPEAQLKQLGATDKQAFFAMLRPAAQAAEREFGVPAAVTLAQAALETGWGQHIIQGYNIFGIKGRGTAGSTSQPTHEVYGGRTVGITANFARYNNFYEGVEAHGKLFHNGYYNKAMTQYASDHDPYAFARNITGIYATDPNYGAKLSQIMRQYNLT